MLQGRDFTFKLGYGLEVLEALKGSWQGGMLSCQSNLIGRSRESGRSPSSAPPALDATTIRLISITRSSSVLHTASTSFFSFPRLIRTPSGGRATDLASGGGGASGTRALALLGDAFEAEEEEGAERDKDSCFSRSCA